MSPWRQPWVQGLAVLALLLAATLAWLWEGPGSQPVWPPTQALPAPAMAPEDAPLPPAPPLQQVANTWQTPLFSPERTPDRPVQAARASADLNGLRLTGVVIDGTVRTALFKQADGHDLSLREGAALANGWRLQRVEAQAVQLELDGQSRRLQLPAPRLPNMPMAPPASSILLDRPAHSAPVPGGH